MPEEVEGEEQMTAEEMQLLKDAMAGGGYGSPKEEEKHNVHTFLHKISVAGDTTKTGFLREEEIGYTPYSVRTYKQLNVICEDLCNDDIWAEYFRKEGEIITATSLSREGFLVRQATTTTRQIADVTKPKVPNKGWFKSNPKQGEGGA